MTSSIGGVGNPQNNEIKRQMIGGVIPCGGCLWPEVGRYVDYMSFILLEIHLVEEVPDQDADGAVRRL